MKRLKQKKGESIAEALVAILVIAFAFVIMTGAVAAAARVNETIKNDETAFPIEGTKANGDQAFSIGLYQKDVTAGSLVSAGEAPATLYYDVDPDDSDGKAYDPHGYYYYDYKEPTG